MPNKPLLGAIECAEVIAELKIRVDARDLLLVVIDLRQWSRWHPSVDKQTASSRPGIVPFLNLLP